MSADLQATNSGLSGAAWTERYSGAVMNTFGPPQRVLVRGEGCYVWDADGNRYLDLLAGIAVNALGHAHPFLVAAVTAQLASLGHVSNFFATAPQIALAERLLDLIDAPSGSRVFFTNSGTEAVEAAFKLARRTGRTGMVAAEGAFHGRTMGALALTHKPAYREPFEPLPGGVVHIPFGDVEALEAAVGAGTAAVVLEPIQGEAGVRVPRADYLPAARRITEQAGALLILDEVQTGIGRTGAWFAHRHPDLYEHVTPDVVTLAKGLGGGIPIGALVCSERAAAGLAAQPGGAVPHASTFGGNALACAAVNAVFELIEAEGLIERVAQAGQYLGARLAELVTEFPGHATGMRGRGLLRGLAVSGAPAQVTARCREKGMLVSVAGDKVVRLAPPYVVERKHLDEAVAILRGVLAEGAGKA